MGRQGWTAALDGWVQIIRGPNEELPKGWAQQVSRSTEDEPRCRPRGGPTHSVDIEELGAIGDVQGLVMEVLKAELTIARTASKQPSVDVEIEQCRRFIARLERRIKELDKERMEERVLLAEAQKRLRPASGIRITGGVTSTNGRFVAVGAGALAEELQVRRAREGRCASSGQETVLPGWQLRIGKFNAPSL